MGMGEGYAGVNDKFGGWGEFGPFVVNLNSDWFQNNDEFFRLAEGLNPRFFEQKDKGGSRAIHDGDFWPVYFTIDIVDSQTVKNGEEVFHGVDGVFSDANGGVVFGSPDVESVGLDDGSVFQINALELDTKVGLGRVESKGDFLAGVDANADDSSASGQGSLMNHKIPI